MDIRKGLVFDDVDNIIEESRNLKAGDLSQHQDHRTVRADSTIGFPWVVQSGSVESDAVHVVNTVTEALQVPLGVSVDTISTTTDHQVLTCVGRAVR